MDFLEVLLPMLFKGLQVTLYIAISGILLGFIIGSITGYVLQGKNKTAKFIAGVYIWIIRGTPLVVQALYVYFVVPKLLHINLSSNLSGIIVIALNSGAFISELVRGALQGIDFGQREAGVSLGLSSFQTLWHIIIPPAFKSMLPALFNQFIISLKDTALLSIIVVNEITKQMMNYQASTFNTIPAYTTGALFYLALISVLLVIQKWVEKSMAV